MSEHQKIYVLGCGAIGMSLTACLANHGRDVVAVRTSKDDVPAKKIPITVVGDASELKVQVETVSLSKLTDPNGTVVVSAKSYANGRIAEALLNKRFRGPIVILQNGLGVETPFVDANFKEIYRGVLYATAQIISENEVRFRQVDSSPVGSIQVDNNDVEKRVDLLNTPAFQFHSERNLETAIWKKTIVNSVFNSICPLLNTDNGIFHRDQKAFGLAGEIVAECVEVARAGGILLTKSEVMEQVVQISRRSEDVLISTLQDIRNGKETEMESLNLELVRIGNSLKPAVRLERTKLLGELVQAKSRCRRRVAC